MNTVKYGTAKSVLAGVVLFALSLISVSGAARAVPVTIDFDGLTPGDVVGDAFVSQGVTFVDAVVIDLGLPGASLPNTIRHVDTVFFPQQPNPIEAIFSTGASSVSLTGLDVGVNGFILKAFDAISGGNLLDSDQVFGTGEGNGQFFTLSVASAFIRRVEFSQVLDDLTLNDGIVFDNFTFSPVPLPAGVWLLLSGLTGMGLLGWRRRRAAAAA